MLGQGLLNKTLIIFKKYFSLNSIFPLPLWGVGKSKKIQAGHWYGFAEVKPNYYVYIIKPDISFRKGLVMHVVVHTLK